MTFFSRLILFERGVRNMTREWQQAQVFSMISVTYGRRAH